LYYNFVISALTIVDLLNSLGYLVVPQKVIFKRERCWPFENGVKKNMMEGV